jgi:hypothetical protein
MNREQRWERTKSVLYAILFGVVLSLGTMLGGGHP